MYECSEHLCNMYVNCLRVTSFRGYITLQRKVRKIVDWRRSSGNSDNNRWFSDGASGKRDPRDQNSLAIDRL